MENVIYARLDCRGYTNALQEAKKLLNNIGEGVELTQEQSKHDKDTTSIMQGDKVVGLLTHVQESYKLGKETREEEYYTVERLGVLQAPAGGANPDRYENQKQQEDTSREAEEDTSRKQLQAFNKAVNFGKVWLLDNFGLTAGVPIKLEKLQDSKAGYYNPGREILINEALEPELYLIVIKHELLHHALHLQGLEYTDNSPTFNSFLKVLNLPATGVSLQELEAYALQ